MLKNEQGTSLLELVIALSLIGVLCAGFFSLNWFGESAFRMQTSQAELQYSARHARQSIMEDVAECKSFSVLNARGGSEVLSGSDGAYLNLVLSDRITDYYVSNNQLYRNSSIASPQPVAENIQAVSFSSPYPSMLNLRITASSKQRNYVLETRCADRIDR